MVLDQDDPEAVREGLATDGLGRSGAARRDERRRQAQAECGGKNVTETHESTPLSKTARPRVAGPAIV